MDNRAQLNFCLQQKLWIGDRVRAGLGQTVKVASYCGFATPDIINATVSSDLAHWLTLHISF